MIFEVTLKLADPSTTIEVTSILEKDRRRLSQRKLEGAKSPANMKLKDYIDIKVVEPKAVAETKAPAKESNTGAIVGGVVGGVAAVGVTAGVLGVLDRRAHV